MPDATRLACLLGIHNTDSPMTLQVHGLTLALANSAQIPAPLGTYIVLQYSTALGWFTISYSTVLVPIAHHASAVTLPHLASPARVFTPKSSRQSLQCECAMQPAMPTLPAMPAPRISSIHQTCFRCTRAGARGASSFSASPSPKGDHASPSPRLNLAGLSPVQDCDDTPPGTLCRPPSLSPPPQLTTPPPSHRTAPQLSFRQPCPSSAAPRQTSSHVGHSSLPPMR